MTDGDEVGRRVLSALDALGEPYEVIECDPDLADTAQFCEHYGIPVEHSANTIIVASKRDPVQFSACVVTATTRLDVNKTVKRLMGAGRLSFASAEQTVELTGMLVGGVTPFALPEALPLYVDRRVMELDYIVVGGGSRSQKISLSPGVFERTPDTQVIEGLGIEPKR
jgi:prolyl-tRNA editing enzyme YbaK/EbsC (Cys-tRNA(Pro) deacylase)